MFFRKLVLGLVVILLTFSCASKKATHVPDDKNITGNIPGKNGIIFELNGDSDANKAGGLETVYFEFNSSVLSRATVDKLNRNIEILKSNPNVKIQIEGHCDERGSVQFNLALGEKRASSVSEHFIGQGIENSRISIISLGKERPVTFGHEEVSWSKNRRANFLVLSK